MTTLSALLTPTDAPHTDDDAMLRARALLALDADPYKLAELCRRRFWAYLALASWTSDPKSVKARIKPFPPLRVYQVLADWLDEQHPDGTGWAHPKVVADKSRQMMLSWFWVLRLDWAALRHPRGECVIISKTDDDGADLLARLKTVHRLAPPWWRKLARVPAPAAHASGRIRYPNGSVVMSLPQRGGDAARGRVPTMALFDEAAFQDSFEENWQAMTGTILDRRSQLCAVSTASPSFFQSLILDTSSGASSASPAPSAVHHDSEGLRLWTNASNRLSCARIHYLADPARRDPAWAATARAGVPDYQWRQEMEIDYSARGGERVFPMVDRSAHLMRAQPTLHRHAAGGWRMTIPGHEDAKGALMHIPVRLIRAIDHGVNNYCGCTWWAVDGDHDWFCLRAYRVRGRIALENARAIAEASGDESYDADVADALAPLPDGTGQVLDIYRDYQAPDGTRPFRGLYAPIKGPHSRQEGLDALAAMLLSTLAVMDPGNRYWTTGGYTPPHVTAMASHSSIYIAPAASLLLDEIADARYDERPGGDPTMDRRETTLDMQDDLLDTARYAIRAGASLGLLRRVASPSGRG